MSKHLSVDAWDAHHAVEKGSGTILVDVRTPVEFRAKHAEGAVNIPLDTIDADTLDAVRGGHRDAPVYLICRTGNRAGMACDKLAQAGVANLFVVEGGTEAWDKAGLPIVLGKKAISLERQVRIVAGTIVTVGSLLAALVHPWFWIVPAFIGSGLAFAGITDTCAMGMLLARMPWNKVADAT